MPLNRLFGMLLLIVALGVLMGFIQEKPSEGKAAVLRVGLLEDSPPYDFYDGEFHLVGMNVDIIQEVGRRLGRPVEMEVVSYNRVVMGLLFHQYDVIAAPQSMSPYRQTVVLFTQPYLESEDVFVYHKNHGSIDRVTPLEEIYLKRAQVAVFNGTSYPQFLKEQGLGDSMVIYPTQREMFLAFLNRKVNVMMMDRAIAEYYGREQKLPFKIASKPIRAHKQMAFSVRKEDVALAEAVNRSLGEMEKDGTLETIREKWLHPKTMLSMGGIHE